MGQRTRKETSRGREQSTDLSEVKDRTALLISSLDPTISDDRADWAADEIIRFFREAGLLDDQE